MSLISLTPDSFSGLVLSQPGPVIVDFYAQWCGPCQAFAPVVEAFAMAHPQVQVCKADVDALPEETARYGIQSVPTVLVFRDGEVVRRTVGGLSAAQLEALL